MKKQVGTISAVTHLAEVEENNRKVRAGATAAQLQVMDVVQDAIDAENAELAARLAGENKLRAWAKELCGVSLDISEIEDLNRQLKTLRVGDVLKFQPRRLQNINPNTLLNEQPVAINLYRTPFNTVDRLEKYIFALERSVVDLTEKLKAAPQITPVVEKKDQYTEQTFGGLIKLAFKQLFKRRK